MQRRMRNTVMVLGAMALAACGDLTPTGPESPISDPASATTSIDRADMSEQAQARLAQIFEATSADVMSIEGTVTTTDRQPAPARMVVAFVEDDRRWIARSRFIRVTETDASGHFVIRGLLPGEYRVAFVEPLEDGAWEDPEVLSSLRPAGAKVIIKAAERVMLDGRVR